MTNKQPNRHPRPRFLLLSPFCDDVWSEIAPRLRRIGDVTIVCLRGQSTIKDYAASIRDLIDERSYVMGFCIGGVVALAAAQIASKAGGIIMISSTPFADNEQQRLIRLQKIDRLRLKAETRGATPDSSYSELVAAWMLSKKSMSRETIRSRANHILGEVTPQMALDNHMAMLSRPDLSDEFLAIGSRILIFVGRHDRVVDARSVIDLADRAPGVQAIVSPDCGHLIPIEAPELVVSATEEWIQRL